MHLLYRHGARYPTSDAAPPTFAQKIANATKTGFAVSGELAFLGNWTYKLGAELLTPFGRSQNFLLGVSYRELYGNLLNNFTEAGTLPVFRTESQDRMVKTAENFAAGFFGVPEYLDQVNIEILVENATVNNSGAPYETCPNSNVKSRGSIGSTVAAQFASNAFNATIARLQSQVSCFSCVQYLGETIPAHATRSRESTSLPPMPLPCFSFVRMRRMPSDILPFATCSANKTI